MKWSSFRSSTVDIKSKMHSMSVLSRLIILQASPESDGEKERKGREKEKDKENDKSRGKTRGESKQKSPKRKSAKEEVRDDTKQSAAVLRIVYCYNDLYAVNTVLYSVKKNFITIFLMVAYLRIIYFVYCPFVLSVALSNRCEYIII